MSDLQQLFKGLCQAADDGRFEAAVIASALGNEPLTLHPLGFHVVKVSSGPDDLRLHFWKPGGVDQPGYEIHDHIFDLESRVIEGAIRHRLYTAAADPKGPYAVYSVDYSGTESRLAKTDERVLLYQELEEVFTAGDTYSVKAGKLHDAEIEGFGSTAMTLVLTHKAGGAARTIGPADGPLTLAAARTPATDQSLRELGFEAAKAF